MERPAVVRATGKRAIVRVECRANERAISGGYVVAIDEAPEIAMQLSVVGSREQNNGKLGSAARSWWELTFVNSAQEQIDVFASATCINYDWLVTD